MTNIGNSITRDFGAILWEAFQGKKHLKQDLVTEEQFYSLLYTIDYVNAMPRTKASIDGESLSDFDFPAAFSSLFFPGLITLSANEKEFPLVQWIVYKPKDKNVKLLDATETHNISMRLYSSMRKNGKFITVWDKHREIAQIHDFANQMRYDEEYVINEMNSELYPVLPVYKLHEAGAIGAKLSLHLAKLASHICEAFDKRDA